MPNIYDIAEKRQGNRMNPIEAAMQGEEWRTNQKARELNVEAADINLETARSEQDEFNANAGSRKQAQMIADNVTKHAEVGRILSSGLSKETYEANAKTLQGLMPEAEFPDSWEEAQDELAQWQPYFDEQYGAQKKIESYRERADKGDKTAAAIIAGLEAEQADKLQTAALKAAKLEQEIATGRANEVKGYAQAGKADAEAQAALMNPGGAGGGRSTGGERARAALAADFAKYQAGEPIDEATAALNVNAAFPVKPVSRMIDGKLVTTNERYVPPAYEEYAKKMLGKSYGGETVKGSGLSMKEQEGVRANQRAFGLVNEITAPLLETVEALPDYYFGIAGTGAKVGAYVAESLPGRNESAEEFQTKKKEFENEVTQLIAIGRELTGEAKNASDKDLKRLEELVGKGLFESRSSTIAALKSFQSMSNRLNKAYQKKLGGTADEEEIEDAESWVNN